MQDPEVASSQNTKQLKNLASLPHTSMVCGVALGQGTIQRFGTASPFKVSASPERSDYLYPRGSGGIFFKMAMS